MTTRHLSENSEIIALFVAAGKEVPHEDSDAGQAIQILQRICDSQSHNVPDADDSIQEMKNVLESLGWNFFAGTAASNPYAVYGVRGCRIGRNTQAELIAAVAKDAAIDNPTESNASEIFEALDEIENNLSSDADFRLDFDGNEYRIINDSCIWDIYRGEIQELVESCYDLKLDSIPDFIAVSIDWEQTAKNAYSDGFGHHFSSADFSEEEICNYYIFRTN